MLVRDFAFIYIQGSQKVFIYYNEGEGAVSGFIYYSKSAYILEFIVLLVVEVEFCCICNIS